MTHVEGYFKSIFVVNFCIKFCVLSYGGNNNHVCITKLQFGIYHIFITAANWLEAFAQAQCTVLAKK